MERYQNRGGNSGVVSFRISTDAIIVQFRDGSQYLYNAVRPGQATVDQMKTLAKAGQGLNSYISRIVRKNFCQKLR